MIDDSCGALADNSGAGFADAVERVLSIPRPTREGAARARATQFTWPDSVSRMLSVHAGR